MPLIQFYFAIILSNALILLASMKNTYVVDPPGLVSWEGSTTYLEFGLNQSTVSLANPMVSHYETLSKRNE